MENKPFSNVWVDYFGPIIVKLSKRTRLNATKARRWGVTCLNTRAVHSELAIDLTVDLFLLSLRWFIWKGVEIMY